MIVIPASHSDLYLCHYDPKEAHWDDVVWRESWGPLSLEILLQGVRDTAGPIDPRLVVGWIADTDGAEHVDEVHLVPIGIDGMVIGSTGDRRFSGATPQEASSRIEEHLAERAAESLARIIIMSDAEADAYEAREAALKDAWRIARMGTSHSGYDDAVTLLREAGRTVPAGQRV